MVPSLWLDGINKNTLCAIRQEACRKDKHPTRGADLKGGRVGVMLWMIRGQRCHGTWVELKANLMVCSNQFRCSDFSTHLITAPCIWGPYSICDPWAAQLQRVYIVHAKSRWCHALINIIFFNFLCIYLKVQHAGFIHLNVPILCQALAFTLLHFVLHILFIISMILQFCSIFYQTCCPALANTDFASFFFVFFLPCLSFLFIFILLVLSSWFTLSLINSTVWNLKIAIYR